VPGFSHDNNLLKLNIFLKNRNPIQKKSGTPFHKNPQGLPLSSQPACLCLGPFRGPKRFGLGEPFGKASLAITAFGLGRFIPMRGRSSWTEEGRYRYPSDAWSDEALEMGFPRPLTMRGISWGRTRKCDILDTRREERNSYINC
jgi:hypothetical protein